MDRIRRRRIYVVRPTDDGRWRIVQPSRSACSFSRRSEAEDRAIALALRAIPSVIRVQHADGTLMREIRYE